MNATTHSLRPLAMDINCSLFPSELLGIEFNMSSAYNRSCMDTVDRPDGPLDHFREFYLVIHGYLSLAVCVFGIIANIANIIVLTRYAQLNVSALTRVQCIKHVLLMLGSEKHELSSLLSPSLFFIIFLTAHFRCFTVCTKFCLSF